MNNTNQELSKYIISSEDECSKDLYFTCLEGKGLLEKSIDTVQQILDPDHGQLWIIFNRSYVPFERYYLQHHKTFEKNSTKFRIISNCALQFRGQCINLSYVEANNQFTLLFHKELVELFNLPSDRFTCTIKEHYRINPKKLVELDEDLLRYCSLSKKLISWRHSSLYNTYLKHYQYIIERTRAELEMLKESRLSMILGLASNNQIEIDVIGTPIKKCFPIALCRTETEKLFQSIKTHNVQYTAMRKEGEQRWCETISSYLKGDLPIRENDSVSLGAETYDDFYMWKLLEAIRNNNVPVYWKCCLWNVEWMKKDCKQVSAMAFYKEFLELEIEGDCRIYDNPGNNGETLCIDLDNIFFSYSDETCEARISLKKHLQKYWPTKEKSLVYTCNAERNEGVDMSILETLNYEFEFFVQEEAALADRLLNSVISGTTSRVRHILETVRPLLNEKRNSRIGYSNTIDIHIGEEEDILVRLSLGFNRSTTYSIEERFSHSDDFEPHFRSWWHLALLKQLKWLKSQLLSLEESHEQAKGQR